MRRTNSDAFELLSLNPNQNRITSTYFWLVNARIFFLLVFKYSKTTKWLKITKLCSISFFTPQNT